MIPPIFWRVFGRPVCSTQGVIGVTRGEAELLVARAWFRLRLKLVTLAHRIETRGQR